LKIERPQESYHAAQTEKKKRKKGETERKTGSRKTKKKEEREESCGESVRSAAAAPSVLSFSSTSVKLV
jgi:hypothetical protein